MFFLYMTFTKLNKIYNFGDLSDYINGHGFIGSATDIEQVYIYVFYGVESVLLSVTYFPTNTYGYKLFPLVMGIQIFS